MKLQRLYIEVNLGTTTAQMLLDEDTYCVKILGNAWSRAKLKYMLNWDARSIDDECSHRGWQCQDKMMSQEGLNEHNR